MALPAQNFAVAPFGRSVTLTKSDTSIFYVNADSTYWEGADSVVVFPRLVDTSMTTGCDWDTDGLGFLGARMLVQPDGRHVFFNADEDSLFFYPQFDVGESWVFYRYDDGTGNYIDAVSFQLATTALIPGYRDSIKVVQLIGRLPGGAPRPTDPYHATFMGLTENNGFFRGFRLPDVPNPPTTLNHQWRGITNPDTGFSLLDRRRVWDLQPGNEQHYRRFTRTGSPGAAVETTDHYKYLTLDRRLSADGDTIILNTFLARFLTTFSESSGTTDTLRLVDTVDIAVPLPEYAFLNALPGEPHAYQMHGFSEQFRDTLIYDRAFKTVYDTYTLNTAEACLEPTTGPQAEWTFIDGLGLFHYANAAVDDPLFVRDEIDLVYYQKDLEVWGTPFDFDALLASGLSESFTLSGITAFPNPVTKRLLVQWDAWQPGGRLALLDLTGRVVMDRVFQNQVEELAIDLPAGLYVLAVSHPSGAFRTRIMVR